MFKRDSSKTILEKALLESHCIGQLPDSLKYPILRKGARVGFGFLAPRDPG